MFGALKSSDSPYGRLMFQPEAENVLGSVDIAIMRRSAFRTFPGSHSKRAHTFRAARRNGPASRARLGSPPFVNVDKHSSVPSGLVAEHMPERRPARIENGLSHPRLCQLGCVHIADCDVLIGANDPGGLLVQMVLAGIRDFRVDRPDALLVPGALRGGKRRLVFAVVLQGRNGIAIAERGEGLEAQVDTDAAIAGRQAVLDLTLEHDIPAASRVLHEVAALELAFDFAGFPEAVALLEIDRGGTVNLRCARDEGYPAQRPLRPEGCAETRTAATLVARRGELPADLRDRVGVDTKLRSDSLCQSVQIEGGWPANALIALPAPLSFALRFNAEVPDLIASDGMAQKSPLAALNPELEREKRHAGILPDLRENYNGSPANR